jgi:hypothetical protein
VVINLNVGELFKRTMGIIDEFSINGTLRSASDNADYRLRFNRIVDRLQKDLAQIDKISTNTQFTHFPFTNQLGDDEGYDLVQHYNSDIEDVEAVGSRGYYFEVDAPATVKIQEETSTDTWGDLSTVSGTSALTSFTAFRGLITPSSTANSIRILFSGSYPYRIRNTALFSTVFAGSTYIPDYREYVKYTMPTDFFELDKIVWEDGQVREKFADYYWENPKTLCIKYDYQGSFTVFYWKYPTDISSDDTTPSTYDSTTLEVSTLGQEVLAYGAAAELLLTDPSNQSSAAVLQNMYNYKRSELTLENVPSNEILINLTGW